MRVLSIGNFTTGWDGSICDEEHIAKALEELGHEVTRWQREETREGAKYDVVGHDFALISQWDNYPDTLFERIRTALKDNGKIVYWAFDYQEWSQEWHQRLIEGADLYLSKRVADSKYDNWQWLCQDFAPQFLNRKEVETQDIDVLFTGSHLPWAKERTEILKAIDERFHLVVHSVTPDQWKAEGLKNVNGPVMDHGLPELYGRAKINLSIDHTIEAGYWSDRNAQIMACGGFVLFHYVPMSESVFRDNIAYFYNLEDCIYKTTVYLDSDIKRDVIASEGYNFAQNNLLVRNRVKDLMTIVESIL